MKEYLQLIKIDFDNMENHQPRVETLLMTFGPGGELTAHGKAAQWLSTQEPVKPYLGYNGEIYPKYQLKTIEVA